MVDIVFILLVFHVVGNRLLAAELQDEAARTFDRKSTTFYLTLKEKR